MTTDRDAARRLGGTLAEYERRIAALEQALRRRSLPVSSLDDRSLVVRDRNGHTRQRIGRQPDGTVTTTDHNGPPPSAPTVATVAGDLASLLISWDGELTGRMPADFKAVTIHVGETSGLTGSKADQVGFLFGTGSFPVGNLTPGQTYYVVLVAWSTSGERSAASTEVTGVPASVDTGVIADGSITGDKLAAQVVYAGTLQSPNYDPANPSGTPGYAINGQQSELHDVLIDGVATGSSASFDTVSATDSLAVAGDDVPTLIGRTAQGLVAYGRAPVDNYTGTNRFNIMTLQFDVVQGRTYQVFTQNFRGKKDSGFPNWALQIHYDELFNNDPFHIAEVHAEAGPSAAGVYESVSLDWMYFATGTGQVQINLAVVPFGSGSVTCDLDPLKVFVVDTGKGVEANTGDVVYSGGGGGGSWHTRTFGMIPAGSTCILGGGGAHFNANELLHQGQTPYFDGNQQSELNFNIPELVGIPKGNYDYLDLWLFYTHWHYNSGGTAVVGWVSDTGHPHGNKGRVPFNRNQGRWINLLAPEFSEIFNAINNGSFNKIQIGPGPSTNPIYYGAVDSYDRARPPKIRARWLA